MTLLCYALASIRRDVRLRNAVLLIASIVFYGYGGAVFRLDFCELENRTDFE